MGCEEQRDGSSPPLSDGRDWTRQPRLRAPMLGWDLTHPPLLIYATAAYIDTFMVYRGNGCVLGVSKSWSVFAFWLGVR